MFIGCKCEKTLKKEKHVLFLGGSVVPKTDGFKFHTMFPPKQSTNIQLPKKMLRQINVKEISIGPYWEDCVLDPRSSSYAQDYQKLDDLSRERKANSSMRKWQL